MKTETLKFDTAKGETSAYVAMPNETNEQANAIILIHEWWGLNDHIKDITNRFAEEGFVAIAPDLFRGKTAANPEEAAKLMNALELEDGLDTIKNTITTAQEKYEISRFGITGFCMGGTFALQAVCHLEGLSASAPFYGDIPDELTLTNLKTPVIFVSGTKDKWINPEKVSELERIAKDNTLPIQTVKYKADHAFFNSTRPEVYDEKAARDAWTKVIAFFNENFNKATPELNQIHPDEML
ncbi:MAG: dienelactone hydrolase family protein [Acidobacteria bacterium]|nr:dienelactone hydrolase family protein [Acidobacteriota bacterium]MCA1637474.1 dienelactone hydrolase family protein [Acidobacteriota bacterium]